MRVLILLLVLCPGLAGAEIYRWTDSEGRVHFGQQPRSGAERVEVKPQVIERDQATRDREAGTARFFQARREEQAQAAEKAAEARAQEAQRCSEWRQQRERLDRARLFYRNDEQGERQFYSDAEVAAARRKLDTLISDGCD